MELKRFQRDVLKDLDNYTDCLDITRDVAEAFALHWKNKGIDINDGKTIHPYNNKFGGVPNVCLKVPTGGGKTFIAACALKRIYSLITPERPRVVVWLVPSRSILEQTLNNLKNPDHPYRQRLNADFNSRVEVFTKEELLIGQNFSPTTVREQLSVCVMSYDSLRVTEKGIRKAYQENESLYTFTKERSDSKLESADDSALMQVFHTLRPVVVVDESHNAKTKLSDEMIEDINPLFILNLSATPGKGSNIISAVSAGALKKESMVKLPVIVYNQATPSDVVINSILLRNRLEEESKRISSETGERQIRPIVLLQAESRTEDAAETYDIIKNRLVDCCIPEEEIAIKTAKIDEIKDIDLLSPDCRVRYIITINALKEGWDCPFAYILATVANKSSAVDVEQIVGRILRQPYAVRSNSGVLNMSFVLTSSNKFSDTVERVAAGLNAAGFSKLDVRVGTNAQSSLKYYIDQEEPVDSGHEPAGDSIETILNPELFRHNGVSNPAPQSVSGINSIIEDAKSKESEFNKEVSALVDIPTIPISAISDSNKAFIMDSFKNDVVNLRIPQFFYDSGGSGWIEHKAFLDPVSLDRGFTLKDKNAKIDFETAGLEISSVDVNDRDEYSPSITRISGKEYKRISDLVKGDKRTAEEKIRFCRKDMKWRLESNDSILSSEIQAYADRVVDNMSSDDIAGYIASPHNYTKKVNGVIDNYRLEYREKQFMRYADTGKIICEPNYSFEENYFVFKRSRNVDKALYSVEADMNQFESELAEIVAGLENVVWWHRIGERGRNSFYINGWRNIFPDFIIRTKKGNIVIVETKGDFLDNPDTHNKLRLGRKWQESAGQQHKYYLVFQNITKDIDGVFNLDSFIRRLREL